MKKRLRAVIIDDEELAQNRLRKLLLDYKDSLEIIGVASDGEEGLEIIRSHKPDVIFCDIHMPVMSGLEMLNELEQQPKVVFTTAFDEYALRSFEENSVDYLLKPITKERLAKSISKLLSFSESSTNHEIESLKELILSLQKQRIKNVIRVSIGNKILLLKLEDVQFFMAEDKLTKVVDSSGKAHFIGPSLKLLETELPENFVRVNRSCILNEDYIKEIRKSYKSKLIFEVENGEKFSVGTSYMSSIKKKWLL